MHSCWLFKQVVYTFPLWSVGLIAFSKMITNFIAVYKYILIEIYRQNVEKRESKLSVVYSIGINLYNCPAGKNVWTFPPVLFKNPRNPFSIALHLTCLKPQPPTLPDTTPFFTSPFAKPWTFNILTKPNRSLAHFPILFQCHLFRSFWSMTIRLYHPLAALSSYIRFPSSPGLQFRLKATTGGWTSGWLIGCNQRIKPLQILTKHTRTETQTLDVTMSKWFSLHPQPFVCPVRFSILRLQPC